MSYIKNTNWQRLVVAPARRFFKGVPQFFRGKTSEIRSLFDFISLKFEGFVGRPFVRLKRAIRRYNSVTCNYCRVRLKPLPIKFLTLPMVLVLHRQYECPHCEIVFIKFDRQRFQFGPPTEKFEDSPEISQLDDIQEKESVYFRSIAANRAPQFHSLKTRAPETNSPVTKVPVTKAPETKAPKTQGPTTRLNGSNATMGDIQRKPIPSFRVINYAQVRSNRMVSRLHLERLARNGRVSGHNRQRVL